MKLNFIPLIDLLCIFTVNCLRGTNNSLSFNKDASIVGKTCPDNKAFTAQNIHSMFICATMCQQDDVCSSFFFSSSAGRCDGCKLVYHDALTGLMEGSMYYKRAVKYSYLRCMGSFSRNASLIAGDMTVERCVDFCIPTMDTYPRFMLWRGTTCFCGDLSDISIFRSEDDCGTGCGGDPTQICGGGSGHYSVYGYD